MSKKRIDWLITHNTFNIICSAQAWADKQYTIDDTDAILYLLDLKFEGINVGLF